jgi:putative F0F1-ATPase subunit (Ca2+/Mg2+ transporter)
MRGVLPVVAAGGTFAAMTVAGLFAGVWLAARLRAPAVVAAGLFIGLALGGYSAYRLLMRSM